MDRNNNNLLNNNCEELNLFHLKRYKKAMKFFYFCLNLRKEIIHVSAYK